MAQNPGSIGSRFRLLKVANSCIAGIGLWRGSQNYGTSRELRPTIGIWRVLRHLARLASRHGSSSIRHRHGVGAHGVVARRNRQSCDCVGSVNVGERDNSNLSAAVSRNFAGRIKGACRGGYPTGAHWPALSQCPLDRARHLQRRNGHRGLAIQASASRPRSRKYAASRTFDVRGNYLNIGLVSAAARSGTAGFKQLVERPELLRPGRLSNRS